jgi:hypothetical protein
MARPDGRGVELLQVLGQQEVPGALLVLLGGPGHGRGRTAQAGAPPASRSDWALPSSSSARHPRCHSSRCSGVDRADVGGELEEALEADAQVGYRARRPRSRPSAQARATAPRRARRLRAGRRPASVGRRHRGCQRAAGHLLPQPVHLGPAHVAGADLHDEQAGARRHRSRRVRAASLARTRPRPDPLPWARSRPSAARFDHRAPLVVPVKITSSMTSSASLVHDGSRPPDRAAGLRDGLGVRGLLHTPWRGEAGRRGRTQGGRGCGGSSGWMSNYPSDGSIAAVSAQQPRRRLPTTAQGHLPATGASAWPVEDERRLLEDAGRRRWRWEWLRRSSGVHVG